MNEALTINSSITLNNGHSMPLLGLGVFQSKEGAEVFNAVKWALSTGYRHIDTAALYGNEKGVGEAIRSSGIPEDQIFVTTKVWNSDQGYENTLKAFEVSSEKLGLDKIDLYLIHWPVAGKFKETWRALEKLYKEGRVKAIGVSNFMIHHLEELLAHSDTVPVVNQFEHHPHLQQPELVDFCKKHGIVPEAWSPIMKGKVLELDPLKKIAEKYGKNPVHIALRWNIQNGVVTIPKSSKKQRIENNAEIFDFELTRSEVEIINSLDKNLRIGPDPDNFDF